MTRQNGKLTRRHGNRGFTLIEAITTVLVLIILSALAVPSYRSFIAGQRINNTSFDITAALMLTRSEAIKRSASVTIAPNGGNWGNGWVVAVGGNTLNQQSALSSDVAIACYDPVTKLVTACQSVTYNSSGHATGQTTPQPPSIQLSSAVTTAVATRCIGIDLSGRPASKKANCP